MNPIQSAERVLFPSIFPSSKFVLVGRFTYIFYNAT